MKDPKKSPRATRGKPSPPKPLPSGRDTFAVAIPDHGSVSAILDRPEGATALLVLAHGAGAGMRHATMERLAGELAAQGIATFRFQFPYMERGTKRPDAPAVATAAVTAAVRRAGELAPELPLFAGGKSFGVRMTTTAAAQGTLPPIRGIVALGFPLHPAGKPATSRADHLARVKVPMLFLQGTRDALAELPLVREIARRHGKGLALHVVEGADHGFSVLKRSGRTDADVWAEIGRAVREFCDRNG